MVRFYDSFSASYLFIFFNAQQFKIIETSPITDRIIDITIAEIGQPKPAHFPSMQLQLGYRDVTHKMFFDNFRPLGAIQ